MGRLDAVIIVILVVGIIAGFAALAGLIIYPLVYGDLVVPFCISQIELKVAPRGQQPGLSP